MLLLDAVHANSSFKALLYASCSCSSDSRYSYTWYVHNIKFNKLLWNYEFIFTKIYFHWKSDLFTKFLYYENLEPYGIRQMLKAWVASLMMNWIYAYMNCSINHCNAWSTTDRLTWKLWWESAAPSFLISNSLDSLGNELAKEVTSCGRLITCPLYTYCPRGTHVHAFQSDFPLLLQF